MIKLIVNADDYGYHENITEAIIESFRRGILSSTTIMVTMPDFQRAIRRAQEEKIFDKIGLHLNLTETEGAPITEPLRECSRFCNPDGKFNAHFHRSKLGRFILTAKERRAVAVEVEAQMRAYIDAGFSLMHLDAHHHSHTDFSIARVVLPIAQRLGFRSVRVSRNMLRHELGLVKKSYKSFINGFIRRQGFICTDYFGSIGDFDKAIPGLPPDCSVEVMLHPRYQKDGCWDMSGELVDFKLSMSSVEDILNRHRSRYRLLPYNELAK